MKSSKEVDWDIAPEGATHYNEECRCPWLKETPPSYFVEGGGAWVEYPSDSMENHLKNHFKNAVKRPQEWDGSGIPPVGTVCEYRLNEYDIWFTCKIVYVLTESDYCFVAWCDHLGSDQFLTFASDRYKLQLRKIKTLEQIAAEERIAAIKEMCEVASKRNTKGLTLMESLYDAGYRKVEV